MKTTSKHIQSSINSYNKLKNKEYLLSPISKTDISIINEFVEMFKKLGKNEVVAIMDNYKLNPDDEILQELMQVNTYLKKTVFEDDCEEEKEKQKYIAFKDRKQETVKISYILRYSKGVDENGYFIVINECGEDIKSLPYLANTYLYYLDEYLRDDDIRELQILLE